MGGLPKAPTPPPPPLVVVVVAVTVASIVAPHVVVVNDPFRLGGLSQSADDDDTELLGDVVQLATGPVHVVGDATGDLELVRGGGGGGIRLFCRSGVRSGTGGLPVSDDVLLNRRSIGFGAVTVISVPVTVVVVVVAVAAAVVAAIDGTV